jgi:hypothetical protein
MTGHRSGDPFHWSVPVTDPGNRQQDLKIGVRDGRVVVKTPPGEGFSMSVQAARRAAASFDAAGTVAESQP